MGDEVLPQDPHLKVPLVGIWLQLWGEGETGQGLQRTKRNSGGGLDLLLTAMVSLVHIHVKTDQIVHTEGIKVYILEKPHERQLTIYYISTTLYF